jgi:adenine-specific DNA-methyltransferase
MNIGKHELDTIVVSDALDYLRGLGDASVDLIVTDPPYMGVKDEEWDNQWTDATHYLNWLAEHLQAFQRVLKDNGSLYLFASPQMAAQVEVKTGEYFNVLNRITWSKPRFSTKAEMFDKDSMRGYFPSSEAIIFAEKGSGDTIADEIAGFSQAEIALKKRIFGDYLETEYLRAGASRSQIAALFPSVTGGLTGCVSNWLAGYNIPTPEQYAAIRLYLNSKAPNGDYLRREYDYLRREYEDLRREYEDLRREYEDLRRPFNANPYRPYTDVWTFKTVQAYPGKHPCEKPLALLEHIILTSSKPDAVVLDCFAGSGATGLAARNLGRRYLLCDRDEHWCNYARTRLAAPYTPLLFIDTPSAEVKPEQAALFGD